jgi:hypothetical protein
MLLGGPFFALITGFGAAYATEQPGPAGDVARAVGEVALFSRTKFLELDRSHRFVDRARAWASDVRRGLQEADRRHGVVSHAKDFASWCCRAVSQFATEHRLVERGAEAACAAVRWVASKVVVRVQGQAPPDDADSNGERRKTE